MAIVNTTRYFLNVFGSVQRDFKQVGGDPKVPNRNDIFQYSFADDVIFFDHFRLLKVKTLAGQLLKGNTCIGMYTRNGLEKRDRPRARINSVKFKDKVQTK